MGEVVYLKDYKEKKLLKNLEEHADLIDRIMRINSSYTRIQDMLKAYKPKKE